MTLNCVRGRGGSDRTLQGTKGPILRHLFNIFVYSRYPDFILASVVSQLGSTVTTVCKIYAHCSAEGYGGELPPYQIA